MRKESGGVHEIYPPRQSYHDIFTTSCPDIYGQFGRIEVVLVEDKYDKFTIPVQGTALVNIDELAKVLS